MNKKDRFFVLVSIFSIISLITSSLLKLFGVEWFLLGNYKSYGFVILETIIVSFVLILQYILIVGCITRYKFKDLFFKMLPYMPLTILLQHFPKDYHVALCGIIMFSTCVSIIPKFSTVLRFVINIGFILIMQLL